MRNLTLSTDLQISRLTPPAHGGYDDYKIKGSAIELRNGKQSKSFRIKTALIKGEARQTITLGDANRGMTIKRAKEELYRRIAIANDPDLAPQYTYEDVEERFKRFQLKGLKRKDAVEDVLKRFIAPFLGDRILDTITHSEIEDEIYKTLQQNGNAPARRVFIYMRIFFKWCKKKKYIPNNPFNDIAEDEFKFERPKRSRVLTREEVPKLFDAIKRSKMDPRTANGLQILLHTGVRSGELIKAKWQHVKLDQKVWFLPSENTKNGKPLLIPLSNQAASLFKALKKITQDSQMVMGNLSDKAMIRALTRLQTPNQKGDASLPLGAKLTVHDLRRSFVTFMYELGAPKQIVEKMVNHTLQGVVSVYNHADYLEPRTDYMQRYSNCLEAPEQLFPSRMLFEEFE